MDIPRYSEHYKNPKLRGKQITMWNLIPEKKMPPTRIVRYCCAELKEPHGEGRFVVTGVRKAESAKRSKRGGLELAEKKSHRMSNYDPDYPTEEMMYHCQMWARKMLNPIIDWTEEEVWEFIDRYKIPYCELYDQGFDRLGCIGCPMGTVAHRQMEFERYPKYKQAYIRCFQRMIDKRIQEGGEQIEKTGEERFESFLHEKRVKDIEQLKKVDAMRTGQERFDWWMQVNNKTDEEDGLPMLDDINANKWGDGSTEEEVFEWWIH
jgi:phosphoadenosine phosphosulfate reductase